MPLRVLFIDDEPLLCELFVDLFSSDQVHIQTFTDPKAAVQECQTAKYDIIFIDFRMRGMTGLQAAQQLPKEIPKYLVTGEMDEKLMEPFKGILKKPLDRNLIRQILEEKINGSNS